MGGINSGWNSSETEYLRKRVLDCLDKKKPLSNAFKETAVLTGRNENSIRNYYYTNLRREMMSQEKDVVIRSSNEYETFSSGEIHHLLRYIVMGVSSGKSVRQCTSELANSDTKLMLRYQNKYRSIVKRHKEMLDKVIVELQSEGYPVDPILGKTTEKKVIRLDTSVNLSEFIKSVNTLYNNGVIDSTIRKNAIYTKAMVEGEYSKMQKATMLYELYNEKLKKIVAKICD